MTFSPSIHIPIKARIEQLVYFTTLWPHGIDRYENHGSKNHQMRLPVRLHQPNKVKKRPNRSPSVGGITKITAKLRKTKVAWRGLIYSYEVLLCSERSKKKWGLKKSLVAKATSGFWSPNYVFALLKQAQF
jgi:hypothetical protein